MTSSKASVVPTPISADHASIGTDKTSEDARRLRRVERLASLLDSKFRLPGTEIRFGWDAIIGLIPGVGDVATAGASVYLVYEATKLGLGGMTIARMVFNIIVDVIIGAIPLLGDVFDIGWKANLRNSEIIRQAMAARDQAVST